MSQIMNATANALRHFSGRSFVYPPLCIPPPPRRVPRGDIAVVVNADTPVADLSLSEVRKVCSRAAVLEFEASCRLLIRAPAARERDVVLRVIYQMSERSSNSIGWQRFFERGRGAAQDCLLE